MYRITHDLIASVFSTASRLCVLHCPVHLRLKQFGTVGGSAHALNPVSLRIPVLTDQCCPSRCEKCHRGQLIEECAGIWALRTRVRPVACAVAFVGRVAKSRRGGGTIADSSSMITIGAAAAAVGCVRRRVDSVARLYNIRSGTLYFTEHRSTLTIFVLEESVERIAESCIGCDLWLLDRELVYSTTVVELKLSAPCV